ncbi:MAG: FMN-binding protein [Oscillospiraceae bacterium]|nr:FMN-binding protein [Oscillospiraceae bacterium]
MKEKVLPTVVLTIICAAAAILLTLAHESTKESIADQRELKFSKTVEALFGECEIKMLDSNFGCDEIKAIAVTEDGKTAVEVVADGYSKGGIDVLIGIDENGAISGIEFVSLGETPGLGSKVRDESSFRAQFIGTSDDSYSFDAVSGATFSSKGMKHAVDTALSVYNENKEAILNG